jgi:uncharacterized protein (TIGR00369 family)
MHPAPGSTSVRGVTDTQPTPAAAPPRERTFTWGDPRETAAAGLTRSGIDVLRAVDAGELPAPPAARPLDLRFDGIEPGRVVLAFEPGEHHLNAASVVHGGVLATLADTTCGVTVQSLLPAGVGCTTLDLTMKHVRPATLHTRLVRCVGSVAHLGARTALAEARVVDGTGRLLATATSTILLARPEQPPAAG